MFTESCFVILYVNEQKYAARTPGGNFVVVYASSATRFSNPAAALAALEDFREWARRKQARGEQIGFDILGGLTTIEEWTIGFDRVTT